MLPTTRSRYTEPFSCWATGTIQSGRADSRPTTSSASPSPAGSGSTGSPFSCAPPCSVAVNSSPLPRWCTNAKRTSSMVSPAETAMLTQ